MRAARLLVGEADPGGVQAEGRALAVAAHALPDVGLVAHRAGRVQQRHAHVRSKPWRRRRATRSRCTPTRSTRRIALPTDFSARIARNTQLFLQQETGTTPRHRSVGRQLLHRAADLRAGARRRWAHIEEVEELGGMAKAIAAGIPKMRIEEAAARTQARIDSGEQTIVGVNKFRVDGRGRRSTSSRSTTAAVREQQIAKLAAAARRARRRPSGGAQRADRGRGAATPTCSSSRSRRRAPRRPSARSRTPWRRCSAATAPRSAPSRASTGGGRSMNDDVGSVSAAGRGVREERGAPAAHPDRQDGPGRPRPRAEGDRLGVRRSRLRRRHRAAVRHARRGRAPGGRERRAHHRRVVAGRRPSDAGAGVEGGAGQGRPRATS